MRSTALKSKPANQVMTLSLNPRISDRIVLIAFLTVFLFCCSQDRRSPVDYLAQKPPGIKAEVFSPGLLTTDSYEHSAPAFSPDGSVVLWTVVDKSYRASMFEMNYESGKWSPPHRPAFADSTADDYYPSFSPDGKKLYFSSRRKVPYGYPETADMRIWEVQRLENGWGDPVPFNVTVSQGQEYAHSIATNGTFYFSSPMGGGTNMNIRKSSNANGTYEKALLLPYNVNSVGYEDGPYVAPDESFLIFESQRPEGIGGSIDLYISFKTKNSHWSIPVNMGSKINSEGSERFARLSPDGKYLFFGSTRNNSQTNWGFDIFWIDASVIDELRNKESAQQSIDQSLGAGLIDALYQMDSEGSARLLKYWIDLYPNSLDATVIYSSVLRKLKQYTEAEMVLTNTSLQWKDNPGIIMEKALVNFGLGSVDDAEKTLGPILIPGPQLRERYIYLSSSLLDMGKFESSDEYFEKAMKISAGSYPYYNRARSYAQLGEKDKAFDVLKKALDFGNNTRKDVEDDPQLQPLKSDVRWKALMESLK